MSASTNDLSSQRPPGPSTGEPSTHTCTLPAPRWSSAGPPTDDPDDFGAPRPPGAPSSAADIDMRDGTQRAGMHHDDHLDARATGPDPPGARCAADPAPRPPTPRVSTAASRRLAAPTSASSVIAETSIYCTSGFEHVHHVLDATTCIQHALAGSAASIECRCTRDGDVHISTTIARSRVHLLSAPRPRHGGSSRPCRRRPSPRARSDPRRSHPPAAPFIRR